MPKKINDSMKADPRVAIIKTDIGIKKAIKESLNRIGGLDRFIKKGETVFVKPNLGANISPSTGAVTNPEVSKALIEIIWEQKPGRVLLGDSPAWGIDSETVYDTTGARQVAEETGCTLVNLDKDEKIECTIPNGERLKKIMVAKTILDCDKLINVPVMKTHVACIVSLGLKNMKGVLPLKLKTSLHHLDPKNGYSGLETGVADLHRLIQPNLTVVDGTTGMEGFGPLDGDPVNMDLIISGENAVFVDAVCAAVMGFDPKEIPTIKLCAENDSINLEDYQLVGLSIKEVKRPFKPCPTEICAGKNVKVSIGLACTGCLAALNTALYRLLKTNRLENVRDLLICVGKNPEIPFEAERVLYMGKCAVESQLSQTSKEAYFVKGCPPVPMKIVQHIMEALLKESFSLYEFHQSAQKDSK